MTLVEVLAVATVLETSPVIVPVTFTLPTTWRDSVGFVVPIPTDPPI